MDLVAQIIERLTSYIYAVQQDTQFHFLTIIHFSQFIENTQSYTTEIYHNFIVHLLGEIPWPTLIQTYFILQHIPNLHIQLVQNAPEDGPVRSETCRAKVCDE